MWVLEIANPPKVFIGFFFLQANQKELIRYDKVCKMLEVTWEGENDATL